MERGRDFRSGTCVSPVRLGELLSRATGQARRQSHYAVHAEAREQVRKLPALRARCGRGAARAPLALDYFSPYTFCSSAARITAMGAVLPDQISNAFAP